MHYYCGCCAGLEGRGRQVAGVFSAVSLSFQKAWRENALQQDAFLPVFPTGKKLQKPHSFQSM